MYLTYLFFTVIYCYSGPHLDSGTIGRPWIQILLLGEQVWLVRHVQLIVTKCM